MMFNNMTIQIKLYLFILIPVLAFLVFAGKTIYTSKSEYNNIKNVDTLTNLNSDMAMLVLNLQRERGLSVDYLKYKNKNVNLSLKSQELQTNKFITTFKYNLNLSKKILSDIEQLKLIRTNVVNFNISSDQTFDFYTKIVSDLLDIQNKVILISQDKHISRMVYQNSRLLLAIENASQEIAILNDIFSGKTLTIKQFQDFSFVHIRQIENLKIYKEFAHINDLDIYANNDEYTKYTDILIEQLSTKTISENAKKWHETSTQRIVQLIMLYNEEDKKLKAYIYKVKSSLYNTFIFTLFIIIFIFTIIAIYAKFITKKFILSLNKLSEGIDNFILFIIYRNKKVVDIDVDSNDEIGVIAKKINKNRQLIEACFRCDEMVIKEVSKAVRNAKNDIHLVQEIKCFADNVMLENMKFDFNEMIEILRLRTDELAIYDKNLEKTIKNKTSELEKVNKTLQVSHKILEDEKVRLSNFSDFLSNLNSVDIVPLANKTLDQICNISGALLGYFMIYENDSLKVLASKAIDNHTLKVNEEFITSSPLIMESLKENKIIDIEDIGEDVLEPVNIGFTEIKLNNFYSFPLVFQNKPLGVVILASSKAIDRNYLQGYILALIGSLNNAMSYNYIQDQSLVLEQANIELHKSDKMKSEFLANMSHELRTPLNSVIGFSSILMKNKKDNLDDKQVDQVTKIHNNGKHLLGLINNILDLSKIESGKVELDPKNIDVIQFTKDTAEMLQGQAASKNIKLSFSNETTDNTIMITTDDTKLRQVIVNIIGNALKFVPENNGEVSVSIYNENKDHKLFICIKDNGIGIPKEKQELIFKPFRQADGSTTRKFGGTGLGLAISKNMIKLLGGHIVVDSTVGVGSTFCILLPKNCINMDNDNLEILTKKSIHLNPSNSNIDEAMKKALYK